MSRVNNIVIKIRNRIKESIESKNLSKYIRENAAAIKEYDPKYVFVESVIDLLLLSRKKIEIQNTKAILDILDPIVFPIAKIVSFCSAASTEIKISGADVAIPIKKKLAMNPEIEKYFEKLSVEVTKKFDPRINNESPTNSKNRASSIAKK